MLPLFCNHCIVFSALNFAMKKSLVIVLAVLLIAPAVFGQQHYVPKKKKKEKMKPVFSLQVGLGYAFQQAGQVTGIFGAYSGTIDYANNGTAYENYKLKKASLSSGLQSAIGVKCMLGEHIGFQLNAAIGLAPTKYTFKGNNAMLQDTTGNLTTTQQASTPVLLMPAIVLQTNGKKNNLYCRLGLALPLNTKIDYHEEDVYATNGPNTGQAEVDDFELQAKSKFSVGFTGAIGLQHAISRNVNFLIEVSGLSMSLYPEKATYKSAAVNGQSAQVGNQSIPFGLSGSNVFPSLGTGTQITEAIPFSNIGINIGFEFKL
jgi:hypothetical protein